MKKWVDEVKNMSIEQLENTFKETKNELYTILTYFKRIDEVQPIIYGLLNSYGRSEELLFYAEQRNDFGTLLEHYVNHRNYLAIIETLSRMEDISLRNRMLYKLFPILFMHETKSCVDLLIRYDFADVDAAMFIPSILQNCYHSSTYVDDAIKLLKHFAFLSVRVNQRATRGGFYAEDGNQSLPLVGIGSMLDTTTNSTQIDVSAQKPNSMFGVVVDEQLQSSRRKAEHYNELGVWRNMTGIWNCLLLLVADASRGNELMELLSSYAIEYAHCDGQFILRALEEKGRTQECVVLRGLMGMHSEAVEKALEYGFLSLAKQNANRPVNESLKKKLWLKIVEHLAEKEDLGQLMHLVDESGELIKIQDILPYMGDSSTIDAFKDEICETLDGCEERISAKRAEIEEHRKAATSLKDELRDLNRRFVVLSSKQRCTICSKSVYSEKFYAFTCGHTFHSSCTKQLKLQTLDAGAYATYTSLSNQMLDAAQKNHEKAVCELEMRLDDIIADECIMCGTTMIEAITQPFCTIDDEEEALTWQI